MGHTLGTCDVVGVWRGFAQSCGCPETAAETWPSGKPGEVLPLRWKHNANKMQLEQFKALEVKVDSENLKDSFIPNHYVHLTSLYHNIDRRMVLTIGARKAG